MGVCISSEEVVPVADPVPMMPVDPLLQKIEQLQSILRSKVGDHRRLASLNRYFMTTMLKGKSVLQELAARSDNLAEEEEHLERMWALGKVVNSNV